MDFATLAILAPYGIGSLIAGTAYRRYHRRPGLIAVSVAGTAAMLAVYTVLLDWLGVSCAWEGFADGPLPVECRAWVLMFL